MAYHPLSGRAHVAVELSSGCCVRAWASHIPLLPRARLMLLRVASVCIALLLRVAQSSAMAVTRSGESTAVRGGGRLANSGS